MFQLIAFDKFANHLPPRELAELFVKLGLEGVELTVRAVEGSLKPEEAPHKLAEVKRIFDDHNLTLPRLASGIRRADDEARLVLGACEKAGVGALRLGGWRVPPGQARQQLDQARRDLAELQPLLERHNVRGAVQTHFGPCLHVNVSACLRMIEHCDPRWLGVQLDTGHLALAGESVDLAVDLLGPYLHHVNFKGSRWDMIANRQTNELGVASAIYPLREGACDFRLALRTLYAAGHREPISIYSEYRTPHYLICNDLKATCDLLAEDVRYVRRLMAEELPPSAAIEEKPLAQAAR